MVLEKIFQFHQCIFAISLLSILEKGPGPSYEETEISINHPRMLCAKLSWNLTSCSREEFFFSNFFNIFLIFRNYLSLNLNPQYPWVLCTRFDRIWPSGSGEKMKMWKVYTQTDGRQAIRKMEEKTLSNMPQCYSLFSTPLKCRIL